MEARPQWYFSSIGLTKSVQPYCRLAIITMQMTPTISWVHGVAKTDLLGTVAVEAIQIPPKVQCSLVSGLESPCRIMCLCITYVVYHAKSIASRTSLPPARLPLGGQNRPLSTLAERWTGSTCSIGGVWYSINP